MLPVLRSQNVSSFIFKLVSYIDDSERKKYNQYLKDENIMFIKVKIHLNELTLSLCLPAIRSARVWHVMERRLGWFFDNPVPDGKQYFLKC